MAMDFKVTSITSQVKIYLPGGSCQAFLGVHAYDAFLGVRDYDAFLGVHDSTPNRANLPDLLKLPNLLNLLNLPDLPILTKSKRRISRTVRIFFRTTYYSAKKNIFEPLSDHASAIYLPNLLNHAFLVVRDCHAFLGVRADPICPPHVLNLLYPPNLLYLLYGPSFSNNPNLRRNPLPGVNPANNLNNLNLQTDPSPEPKSVSFGTGFAVNPYRDNPRSIRSNTNPVLQPCYDMWRFGLNPFDDNPDIDPKPCVFHKPSGSNDLGQKRVAFRFRHRVCFIGVVGSKPDSG